MGIVIVPVEHLVAKGACTTEQVPAGCHLEVLSAGGQVLGDTSPWCSPIDSQQQ